MPLEPITRTEHFYARIAGDGGKELEPITRTEHFLQRIIEAGGGTTPEEIQAAVDNYLDNHPTVTGTFTNEAKYALLALLQKVAYVDADGQSLLDALESELFAVSVESIFAVFNQGQTVIYSTDSLDDLKPMLTVTALYEGGDTKTVMSYTLSGTLTGGTSTITVAYGGKTTTFNVVNVIQATDVTPSLSSYQASGVSLNIEQLSDGIRVYSTQAVSYRFVATHVPVRKGYTYRLSYDQLYVSGDAWTAFRYFQNNVITSGTGTSLGVFAFNNNSGSYDNSVNPSDHQNWNDATTPDHTWLAFFVNYSASSVCDVTFRNIKLIEYLEEEAT